MDGLGFIGSNLVKQILNKSDNKIIVIDNFRNNQTTFKNQRVTIVNSDIVNQQVVQKLFLIYMPQVIINLVGSDYQKNIRSNFYQNILGTFNVIEQLKKVINKNQQYKNKVRFIQYSSLDVFDLREKQDRITECTRYNPTSVFGAIKLSSQVICREYINEIGIKSFIIHSGNIIGNSKKSYIDKIVQKLLSNQTIYLNDEDYIIQDWLLIDEIVDGIIYLINTDNQVKDQKQKYNDSIYNLSKGFYKTKKEIIFKISQILTQIFGKNYNELIIQKQGQIKNYNNIIKYTKIKKLGWTVQNSIVDEKLSDIIKEIVNKYLKR